MSNLAIQQMTWEDKLRAMEELWESLSTDASKLESPAWHGDALRETEQRYDAGQERPVDWAHGQAGAARTPQMKLRILPSALQDLRRGQDFYSRQSDSLGDYFLDSVFSDIDSLELYAGVHAKVFGYHRLLLNQNCGDKNATSRDKARRASTH